MYSQKYKLLKIKTVLSRFNANIRVQIMSVYLYLCLRVKWLSWLDCYTVTSAPTASFFQ